MLIWIPNLSGSRLHSLTSKVSRDPPLTTKLSPSFITQQTHFSNSCAFQYFNQSLQSFKQSNNQIHICHKESTYNSSINSNQQPQTPSQNHSSCTLTPPFSQNISSSALTFIMPRIRDIRGAGMCRTKLNIGRS
jgi:hypothetical protein